jgi:hypothetical protein
MRTCYVYLCHNYIPGILPTLLRDVIYLFIIPLLYLFIYLFLFIIYIPWIIWDKPFRYRNIQT